MNTENTSITLRAYGIAGGNVCVVRSEDLDEASRATVLADPAAAARALLAVPGVAEVEAETHTTYNDADDEDHSPAFDAMCTCGHPAADHSPVSTWCVHRDEYRRICPCVRFVAAE